MGHKLLPLEGLEQELHRAPPALGGGLRGTAPAVAAGDWLEVASCPGCTPRDPSSFCPEHQRAALLAWALLGGEGVPSP